MTVSHQNTDKKIESCALAPSGRDVLFLSKSKSKSGSRLDFDFDPDFDLVAAFRRPNSLSASTSTLPDMAGCSPI